MQDKQSLEKSDAFQLKTLIIPFDNSCMLTVEHQLPSESAPDDLSTSALKCKIQKHSSCTVHILLAVHSKENV